MLTGERSDDSIQNSGVDSNKPGRRAFIFSNMRGRTMMTIGLRFMLVATVILIGMGCSSEPQVLEWSLALHGGAGTIKSEDMTPEKEAAIRYAMQLAIDKGQQIL